MNHSPAKKTAIKAALVVCGVVVLAILGAAGGWLVWHAQQRSASTTEPGDTTTVATQQPSEPAKVAQPPKFDTAQHSVTAPESLWVIVNKQHPLAPAGYVPTDLVTGVQGYVYSQRIDKQLRAMIAQAAAEGVTLQLSSAYRSYANQQVLYANYVAQYGQAQADAISARPGHSEHQTGLAVDIGGVTNPACNFNECFGDTVEGKWLAAHVHAYGFVVRYTKQNGSVSGYSPEPWHIRYVGVELAAELERTGTPTLEEFFGVTGGWQYVGV